MSWDLSWLWDTLNGIVATMQTWFASLWNVTGNITNTGQGLFSGLVAFGTQLWDAFIKAMEAIGTWIYNAFKWIYDGLSNLASIFGSWFAQAFTWLASGVQWVASQIYNFGMWLYNCFTYIWSWIVNTALGVWNAIIGWFSGVVSAIAGWWASITSAINTWFTNILKAVRAKMLSTIIADVSVYFGWKGMERLSQARDLKDVAFGFMGILASPFTGYIFAHIVNSLIPSTGSEPFPLIPTIGGFAYTPPSLSIETPEEKAPPSTPPTPPMYGYYPLVEKSVSLVKPTYQARWDVGTDKTLPSIAISYTPEALFENNHATAIYAEAYGDHWAGQTFTPATKHKLVKVVLKLQRVGTPSGNLIVSIRNVDGEGKPTGADLVSKSISAMSIPLADTDVEFYFDTWLTLEATTKYAIVLRCPDGTYMNMINASNATGNPYANGDRVWSVDGGSTWNIDTDEDLWFEDWGFWA